jgi:CubicO group peptidase (beta-lactamase class C family)
MIRSLTASLFAGLILVFATWPAQGAEPAPDRHSLRHELDLAQRWLAAQRAYDRVPGLSAAIVHDQDLLWSGASGYADLESQRPARDDTIYGICSISKLFTGIAVMQLRDRGAFTLDQPLGTLLP